MPPLGGCARVSMDDISGYDNEMEVEDDLEGTAVLFAYFGDDLFELDFDITAEPKSSSPGQDREYEFDMESEDDSSLDFTMDCEMNSDKDELDCEGDDLWGGYVLEWDLD